MTGNQGDGRAPSDLHDPYREALHWLRDPERELWPIEVALAFALSPTFQQFGLAVSDPAELRWLAAFGEGYERKPDEETVTIPAPGNDVRTITVRQKQLSDLLGGPVGLFARLVGADRDLLMAGRFNAGDDLAVIPKETLRWLSDSLRILSGAGLGGVLARIEHRGKPYLGECGDWREHIWGTPRYGGRVWTDLHLARFPLMVAYPKPDLPEFEQLKAQNERRRRTDIILRRAAKRPRVSAVGTSPSRGPLDSLRPPAPASAPQAKAKTEPKRKSKRRKRDPAKAKLAELYPADQFPAGVPEDVSTDSLAPTLGVSWKTAQAARDDLANERRKPSP